MIIERILCFAEKVVAVSMLAAIAGWVINSLMIEYYGSSFAA